MPTCRGPPRLRFCVPVFVALWAYYFERGLAERPAVGALDYYGRRTLRLLVPYAFWTALYLALSHSPADWRTTPLHTIVGGWFGGYGWPGQYFFLILFQLILVLPVLRREINVKSLWWIVGVGVVMNWLAVYVAFQNTIVSPSAKGCSSTGFPMPRWESRLPAATRRGGRGWPCPLRCC